MTEDSQNKKDDQQFVNKHSIAEMEQEVHSRKEVRDAVHTAFLSNNAVKEGLKHSQAVHNKLEYIADKKEHAHLYAEDLIAARARKDLYDAIEESDKHAKKHEMLLKSELAEANRADFLRGIQEKQIHLQDSKH